MGATVDSAFKDRMLLAYREHPLSADALLRRLQNQFGANQHSFSELNLCTDIGSGITDQNHVGGVEAVIDLASALCVACGSRILDVGSGIGGPARLLALLYGAYVTGVDIAENRVVDSNSLTKLVGLDEFARFTLGDFLQLEEHSGPFDGAYFLDSYCHFANKSKTLGKAIGAVRVGGRVVIQDLELLRAPKTAAERIALAELESHWNVLFSVSYEQALLTVSYPVNIDQRLDLSTLLRNFLGTNLALLFARSVAEREVRGCQLGIELCDAGILGYSRITLSRQS